MPARANAQLAFGTYRWEEERGVYGAAGLDLLAFSGGRIAEVVSFLAADFAMFGLPAELGLAAYREAWPAFFAWQAGGASFTIESLDVTVGEDVASPMPCCGAALLGSCACG